MRWASWTKPRRFYSGWVRSRTMAWPSVRSAISFAPASPRERPQVAERWTGTPQAVLFWPYLSTAWRLIGDPRWDWLDGDPRLVGVYDLGDQVDLPALADRLRSLHFASRQPLDQSLRGGTQTKGDLFARTEPEIRALRAAVVGAVESHVAPASAAAIRGTRLCRRRATGRSASPDPGRCGSPTTDFMSITSTRADGSAPRSMSRCRRSRRAARRRRAGCRSASRRPSSDWTWRRRGSSSRNPGGWRCFPRPCGTEPRPSGAASV